MTKEKERQEEAKSYFHLFRKEGALISIQSILAWVQINIQ
jgi:hypothetical protein